MTGRHPVSVNSALLVEQILCCILDIVRKILSGILDIIHGFFNRIRDIFSSLLSLLGQILGSGDIEKAKDHARKMRAFTVFSGALFGLLMVILSI